VSTLNVDWLNKNALRAYPVRDTATLKSTAGINIPTGLIVDCVMSVPFDMGTTASITRIVYSPPVLVAEFSIGEHTASVTVSDTEAHKEYQEYTITFNGDYAGIAKGSCVFGTLSIARGVHSVELPLELRCVRPSLIGVTGLGTRQATGITTPYATGLIDLVAGSNITLQVIPVTDQLTQIKINATETELEEECECAEAWAKPKPITSINGVSPDESGNIRIEALDTCIQLGEATGSVTIEDTCSTPCCSCEELEAVMTASKLLENNVGELTTQLAEIQTQQLNYQMLAAQRSTLEDPGGD